MSKDAKAGAAAVPQRQKNRTVKVKEDLHHKYRVLSVQRRVPLQHLIEQILELGLRDKLYAKVDKAAA